MTTVREGLSRLDAAQKPGAGVPAYTRWVNRRLARYAAATAVSWGISANAVTGISAMMSAAGLVILIAAPISWWSALAVAALLAGGYVLDSADGQVARLTATGGPAGEWLDHVVDAVRTPAIHLAVAVAVWNHAEAPLWLGGVALAFALLAGGQFMSQILAEQLRRVHGLEPDLSGRTGSTAKSFILLPNDMGSLCWIFVFWGAPAVFAVAYSVLFALNAAHGLVSMRRKHAGLVAPQ